ncbi:unnamed protein product [Eruca vesicaria subsp. sativa]|uniref:NYN domain-containing protein n=1 Tax=Eruca vesicaria subsp. sativa TaxID=29727 RepID=A0ABC8JLG7_ERUVS|nr:unnamed protein product [Eruca vesicaria subsp. sativa]
MDQDEFSSSWNETTVLWNMDDYPIPVGIDDLGSIRKNIEEALQRFGFHGPKDVNVHCKHLECDIKKELSDARIFYLPSCTKTYMTTLAHVDKVITMDMTSTLVKFGLTCQDPPDDEEFSFSVESLLGYAHFVLGASDSIVEEDVEEDPSYVEEEDLYPYPYPYPYPYTSVEEEEEEEEEDVSKILDFLEPIRPVKRDMTAVFWDGEDCPFPYGSTPDEIYHSITSALVEMKFSDKITIWAYLDDDEKGSWRDVLLSGDKTWDSRIYFLPGGDKDSRRIRMANDIILFLNSGCPRDLVLVSDQFKADLYYLELLYYVHSVIVFIVPTQDINKPESPEWPRLLIDEGYHRFANIRKFSYEPCPKEQRLIMNAESECPEETTY